MQTLEYNAVMNTPIGYRVGQAIVQITDQIVNGIIRFFGKEGKYQGTIDKNGYLNISGTVPTPNNIENFEGKGKFSFYALHMDLKTKECIYELDGTSKG